MRMVMCVLALLLPCPVMAAESCIEPATLTESVVSIARDYTPEERARDPDFTGVRATAWFLYDNRHLVTATHFLNDPRGGFRWSEFILHQEQRDGSLRAQKVFALPILVVTVGNEGFAVLMLEQAFPDARPLYPRKELLTQGETVLSVAYPQNTRGTVKVRFAKGTFAGFMDEAYREAHPQMDKVPLVSALFEMVAYEGGSGARYVLDHGASGAPIVDCRGRVVAGVGNVILQEPLRLGSHEIRLTTPWGMPNVVGLSTEMIRLTPKDMLRFDDLKRVPSK